MEIDTAEDTADAVAPEGAVRPDVDMERVVAELRALTPLVQEKHALSQRLHELEPLIAAHFDRIRALEGR